jgi:hypothetical protein
VSQSEFDSLKHAFPIREYVIVPETKHPIALLLKPLGATGICRLIVLTAIRLHDEPSLPAAEIDYKDSDRPLPLEFVAT